MAKQEKKVRGVFEKVPGSGVWWIRFIDAEGALRREKAGSKSGAITLYGKRKSDAWQGKKLPKKLRSAWCAFQNWPTITTSTRRPTTPAGMWTSTGSKS